MTWKRALAVLAIVVSGGLLFREWAKTGDSIDWPGSEQLPLLLGAIGFQAFYVLVNAERYRRSIVDQSGSPFSRVEMTHTYALGRILNTAIGQAGTAYKGYSLRSKGLPLGAFIGGHLQFTWISLIVSLAVGIAAGLIATQSSRMLAISALVAWLSVSLAAPFILKGVLRLVAKSSPRLARVVASSRVQVDVLIALLRRPTAVLPHIVLAVVALLAGAAAVRAVLISVGGSPSWTTALLLVAVLQTVGIVALTPGNIGVQEAGFALVSGAAGTATSSQGVASSLLLRVSGFAALVLVALASSALRARGARRVSASRF